MIKKEIYQQVNIKYNSKVDLKKQTKFTKNEYL